MKIANEKLPGVQFDTPWTEKEGGKAFYEAFYEVGASPPMERHATSRSLSTVP